MSSGIVPSKAQDKITWYATRAPVWNSHAAAIGTTVPKVTALQTKITAAQAAYAAQQTAIAGARTATNTYNDAVKAMAISGSDIIKDVRAKAATDGNTVYDTAMIPPPAIPSPLPPPGTPSNFKVTLNPDGSLAMKWKCTNPGQGQTYQVYRQIGGSGAFNFIGASGNRTFIDGTLPAGTASVTYKIVAVRTTAIGTAAEFLVKFGVGGAGEMTASVVLSPKLAA